MSHHVYNTRGFIVAARPRGEADKLFSILTPDLGLVRAVARGVRRERSRLRGFLIEQALVSVSLVRGKSSWRITTVGLERDVTRDLGGEEREVLARVASLIDKLIHGEEHVAELFNDLIEGLELLPKSTPEVWEIWMVARVLYRLGYLAEGDVPVSLAEVEGKERDFVGVINRGIRSSGLL